MLCDISNYLFFKPGPHYVATIKIINVPSTGEGHVNSVGLATRYGLDGPGIEFRWRWDFPHPSRPALWPLPVSCTIGTVSFPGLKTVGVWRWPRTNIWRRG